MQISCEADGKVLAERFKQWAKSGERHPGHGDMDNFEGFAELLTSGKAEILDVPGKVLKIDTTDFESINYENIRLEILNFIEEEN